MTITFFRDMPIAPRERQTETIMGSISGVRPTATARAKKNASVHLFFLCLGGSLLSSATGAEIAAFGPSSSSCFVSPLMRNTSGTITAMK